MKTVRLAIIGVGGRGFAMLKNNFVNFPNVMFTAICDVYEDRIQKAADLIKEKRGNEPFCTTDYREVLTRDDVDVVYVASSWNTHVEISIASLYAGKVTAMEVGGVYDIKECYDLVRAYEETKVPFMFMENCCYNRTELMATAMARDGLFGEIVHCVGAYAHDLRSEIGYGNIRNHYRLWHYVHQNYENYPTHELGPIAKLLNINRGNRMVSLVSVASKARGLAQYVKDQKLDEQDPSLKDLEFAQGDVVTTVITCENGETITLNLDTTLPRSYSREFTIRGVKGMYEQRTNTVFLDGDEEIFDTESFYRKALGNAASYEEKYMPEVWKNITADALKYGHGGMDGIMFGEFLLALTEGREMPVDVYDAAAWMSVSALSARSIAEGGAPQQIPDFTNGAYRTREPKDVMDLSQK